MSINDFRIKCRALLQHQFFNPNSKFTYGTRQQCKPEKPEKSMMLGRVELEVVEVVEVEVEVEVEVVKVVKGECEDN